MAASPIYLLICLCKYIMLFIGRHFGFLERDF